MLLAHHSLHWNIFLIQTFVKQQYWCFCELTQNCRHEFFFLSWNKNLSECWVNRPFSLEDWLLLHRGKSQVHSCGKLSDSSSLIASPHCWFFFLPPWMRCFPSTWRFNSGTAPAAPRLAFQMKVSDICSGCEGGFCLHTWMKAWKMKEAEELLNQTQNTSRNQQRPDESLSRAAFHTSSK